MLLFQYSEKAKTTMEQKNKNRTGKAKYSSFKKKNT